MLIFLSCANQSGKRALFRFIKHTLLIVAWLLPVLFLLLVFVNRDCLPLGLFLRQAPHSESESPVLTRTTKLTTWRETTLGPTGKPKASDNIVHEPGSQLMKLYLKQLESMPIVPEKLWLNQKCPEGIEPPCRKLSCNVTFPSPEKRLTRMLSTQHPIDDRHKEVIDSLTDRKGGAKDVVFITAASENHYEEVLGVLHSLEKKIFPRMRNESTRTFKLLCYDLGFTAVQLEQLKQRGSCSSVIRVPLESLPESFRLLKACAWKPLLIQANVHLSKVTVWMDASTRFQSDDVERVIAHTLRRGLLVDQTPVPMARHIADPALRYFNASRCLVSPFMEIAGGFIAVRNDLVWREAVLAPWVSCAFSPSCLCPGADCVRRYKSCETPRFCHRFDQSVLGAILVSLFDWRMTSLYGPRPRLHHFRRWHPPADRKDVEEAEAEATSPPHHPGW